MKHNFGLLLLLADTSNFEICEIYPFITDNVCLCICCGVNRGIWSLFTSFCRVCLPALSFLVVLAVSGGNVNGLMSIKLRFSCFCKYHTCLYSNNRSGASEKLKNWALQCHIKKERKKVANPTNCTTYHLEMEMEKKSLQVSRHIATDVLLHNEKKLKFHAKANPL